MLVLARGLRHPARRTQRLLSSSTAAPRTPTPLVAQLAGLAAADVIQSQGLAGGIDPAAIAPLWRPIDLCGPAFTVRSLGGDNLAVHRALIEAPEGCVLAVESVGTAEEIASRALIGDIIAYAALKRGLAGLITNAPVRDGRRMQELGFPVYAGVPPITQPPSGHTHP